MSSSYRSLEAERGGGGVRRGRGRGKGRVLGLLKPVRDGLTSVGGRQVTGVRC